MKSTIEEHRYFYVDETGDPNFFGKNKKLLVGAEGCSRTFGIGFLRTTNPAPIRDALSDLRTNLTHDRYLMSIPSMKKTLRAFHAKDDCAEVRKAVYECMDRFEFSVQIIVARKHADIFEKKHRNSQDVFYDDLVSKLFERQLHLATNNTILFSRRQTKRSNMPCEPR